MCNSVHILAVEQCVARLQFDGSAVLGNQRAINRAAQSLHNNDNNNNKI